MRFCKVLHNGRVAWAHETAEGLIEIDEGTVLDALRGDRPAHRGLPFRGSLKHLPPLLPDINIYCIGLNYKSHIEETARDLPPQPSVFVRVPGSIVGHDEPVVRPKASDQYDYEGELAVVIGRPGRHVPEDEAWSYVAAMTCFNDGSVRDFQKHSVTAGKNFDSSGACGPSLVTIDELSDPKKLQLTTRLNGQVMQQSDTSLLIYSIARIVNYVSTIVQLRTGDVIATGTPAGVGARRTPPVWMKPGDRIEVEIEGIGVLANVVVDETGSGA